MARDVSKHLHLAHQRYEALPTEQTLPLRNLTSPHGRAGAPNADPLPAGKQSQGSTSRRVARAVEAHARKLNTTLCGRESMGRRLPFTHYKDARIARATTTGLVLLAFGFSSPDAGHYGAVDIRVG
eukprot:366245-Chlamydomonas_euryale.AAC.19